MAFTFVLPNFYKLSDCCFFLLQMSDRPRSTRGLLIVNTVWMNEWMYLYTAHITYCLKAVYNSKLSEIERQLVKAPLAAAINSYLISLTHPTHAWSVQWNLQIDHNTGNYVPCSFRQVCGFFNVPCWPCNTENAGEGAYGLKSLSEKTWMSNHLQIKLQRQHILLSYFKTLSVGPWVVI